MYIYFAGFLWVQVYFAWIYVYLVGFIWFCVGLYRFMLIYMRFNVFVCVFDVFMSLVWPTSVPQALFSNNKGILGFLDYVNSGNWQNCQNFCIYGLWDLSNETRPEKSWISAVLRPPDVLRRADWWTKPWIEYIMIQGLPSTVMGWLSGRMVAGWLAIGGFPWFFIAWIYMILPGFQWFRGLDAISAVADCGGLWRPGRPQQAHKYMNTNR